MLFAGEADIGLTVVVPGGVPSLLEAVLEAVSYGRIVFDNQNVLLHDRDGLYSLPK